MQSPRVGLSLRWKITLPYMFLALGLGLIAILLINRLAAERARDRFTLLLADSGQQATDAVVRVERDLLEVERVAANTQGVLEAAVASDAEQLRVLILPVVVNARVDMLVVLDPGGTSLLTVRQIPGAAPGEYETLRGENFYAGWPAAQRLLAGGAGDAGEKTAGVEWIRAGGTTLAVFFVGGPLLQSDARPAGAVLVGLYASTLADVLSETAAAAANVSLYNTSGELLGTTLELEPSEYLGLRPEVVQEVAAAEPDQSPVRRIQVAGQPYGEVLVPFVAHDGAQRLGIMGVSLLESGFATATDTTTVVAFAALALMLTVVIGLLISNSITRPLVRMAAASGEVARGNLETRVPEGGNDEIGVLSRTFNRMVEGMREGLAYHDLLGRAVAPEVREQLKRSSTGETGRPQVQRATILSGSMRGFTRLENDSQAETALNVLNEFLRGALPRIGQYGGVVYHFDGEELLALFGILPRALPPAVSAMQATHAGLDLLEMTRHLNQTLANASGQPLELSLGVATGRVLASSLGTKERTQFAVLGEAVADAQQLQEIARDLGENRLLIGEATHQALGQTREHFIFGRQGKVQPKGKGTPLVVYEVSGRSVRLFERDGESQGKPTRVIRENE
ncbi:MAG TPA: HAMP domain-containing protein [Anaerolineales bacterium]|nr:HAMP domain-containing protein [Anaerolineales bacterium]